MNLLRSSIAGLVMATMATAGHAGEWTADRLRGVVLMMVDGQWEAIKRGDIIEDSRVIRTGANGQATFVSGDQIVELKRNTQIQISSATGRDHTWILHAGGQLTADVEARDVEHFGVVTQHMVAVVKGTRFTVNANQESASVSVERGNVVVNESDAGLSVTLATGNEASAGGGQLSVSGEGQLPTVRDATGRAIANNSARVSAGNESGYSGIGPGNSTNASGQGGDSVENPGNARGRSSDGPGNSANAPGRGGGGTGNGNGPGNSRNAPGRGGDGPGNSGHASGGNGNGPGNSGNAPGRGEDGPGNSGHASGGNGNGSGKSGNASGGGDGSTGNNAPGNSGNTPAAEKSSGRPGNR